VWGGLLGKFRPYNAVHSRNYKCCQQCIVFRATHFSGLNWKMWQKGSALTARKEVFARLPTDNCRFRKKAAPHPSNLLCGLLYFPEKVKLCKKWNWVGRMVFLVSGDCLAHCGIKTCLAAIYCLSLSIIWGRYCPLCTHAFDLWTVHGGLYISGPEI
jgi:hypothetical protein